MIYYILLGRIYSCPEGKGKRGLQGPIRRCPTSPTPPFAYERQPQHRDHFFLRPTELSTSKELWDGTSGLSSLSEKTSKSNHLQMKLQRQHFLLSYLKTGWSRTHDILRHIPVQKQVSYRCRWSGLHWWLLIGGNFNPNLENSVKGWTKMKLLQF